MNIAVIIREKIDPVGNPIFSDHNKKISDLNKILSIDNSDLSAMSSASKIKKQFPETTIHVYYIGNNHYMLRSVLALGADFAELVKIKDGQHMFDFLPEVYQIMGDKEFDLILTGQQGAGADGAGANLAFMAGATLITAALKLEIKKEGKFVATRTLGRGKRQVVSFTLPGLVMCDRMMNIEVQASISNLLNGTRIKITEHELKIISKTERITLQTPKPRPKKIFMPESKAGASSRLKQILSGGVKQREMDKLEGEPKEIAQQFISYLKKENIISK